MRDWPTTGARSRSQSQSRQPSCDDTPRFILALLETTLIGYEAAYNDFSRGSLVFGARNPSDLERLRHCADGRNAAVDALLAINFTVFGSLSEWVEQLTLKRC